MKSKSRDETKRYEMPGGKATISLPKDAEYIIDPNGWLLKSL
ncbi:MAG: hypothetical protein WKF71_18690 [Pyrinomonadaceae bacterium]